MALEIHERIDLLSWATVTLQSVTAVAVAYLGLKGAMLVKTYNSNIDTLLKLTEVSATAKGVLAGREALREEMMLVRDQLAEEHDREDPSREPKEE